jgi:hypothetical protein
MSGIRTVLVAACVGMLAMPAYAHFKLNAPTSRSEQDGLGGPQKSAPCGLSDVSATADDSTPTNVVSTLKAGSMVSISINETIFHPGHYRVQLAQNIASLPADPPVTAGSTACGSTVINANPTAPLIGDGLLKHTAAFSGTQTMMVQLPAGMTCTNCVLQVTQFMSNHGLNNPGGCFYHHCAIVNITNDGPMDAGVTNPDADTVDPMGGKVGSSCCGTNGGVPSVGSLLLAALVAGVLVLRRRRSY